MHEEENKFDITKLYQNQENRNNLRLSACSDILRRIHSRINLIVKHGHRTDTSCVFEVPKYLVGYPIYDPSLIVNTIVSNLKSEGFYVEIISGSNIYISWDKQHIEAYVKAQRPVQLVNSILSSSPSYDAYGQTSSKMNVTSTNNNHHQQQHHHHHKPSYHSTGKLFKEN